MDKRLFSELGLSPEILKAVDKMGFEEASPIQTAVIPVALAGRDVVGQSSTGSGKTAAFGIPAIERTDVHVRACQVLILCPTRELAVQVAEEVAKLAFFKKGLHAVPIYGGQSYDRQFRALEAGTQIVIGTPGRIMDHMQRGTLRLDKLKLVVLDEADRMLDMGFREDIELILKGVPETRQILFFSATMPRIIQDLIGRFTKDPAWLKIEAIAQNAPQVEQVYFEVDRRSKLEALTRVIDLHDFNFGIIFCSTKVMVDDLDEHLHARGYSVDRLHGDISQAQRDRVMEKFRRRGFEFLVATDVAARGLDVDDLEVVFNFDLPNDAEDYTHRIGRTGRAGKSGYAYTFVSGREIYKLQNMMYYAKFKIRREYVPSIDQIEEVRENVFFEKLRSTLAAGEFKKEDRMIDRLLEQGYSTTDIASALLHMMQGNNASGEKGAAPGSGSAAAAPKALRPALASATPAAPAPKKAASAPLKSALNLVPKASAAVPAPSSAPAPQGASSPSAPVPAAAAAPAPLVVHPQVVVTPAPALAHKPLEVKKAHFHAPAQAPVAHVKKAAAPAPEAEDDSEYREAQAADDSPKGKKLKAKFERGARTGREEGMTTLYFNVGKKHLVTPSDLVGKIAGVTRLPASVVGAIDLHVRHALVDVATEHVPFILGKLNGVRLKNHVVIPSLVVPDKLPTD